MIKNSRLATAKHLK